MAGFALVCENKVLWGEITSWIWPSTHWPFLPPSLPPSGSSECEWSDSGSDLRVRKKFPSLLHGKRSAPELPHLPPANCRSDPPGGGSGVAPRRDEALPGKCKPQPKPRPSPKSPRRFSFEQPAGFSEDEAWTRRRSERIFLHDAVAGHQPPPPPPSGPATPLSSKPASRPKPPPPSREGKEGVKVGWVIYWTVWGGNFFFLWVWKHGCRLAKIVSSIHTYYRYQQLIDYR